MNLKDKLKSLTPQQRKELLMELKEIEGLKDNAETEHQYEVYETRLAALEKKFTEQEKKPKEKSFWNGFFSSEED